MAKDPHPKLDGEAKILLELEALRICYTTLLAIEDPARHRVIAAVLCMLDEDRTAAALAMPVPPELR